ncbi:MAG: Ig-like domain-containing protein [Lachnospiraceae bacterium]|nr:Ig-like domain-containing protein [Lachnospiraceae bacterium]
MWRVGLQHLQQNWKVFAPRKFKLNKKKVTLNDKKTFQINAKTVKVSKRKSLLSTEHAKHYRYYSSRKAIAKVSKDGKIKAVSKGKCVIYVFAQNGTKAKIKVTVK